VDHPIIALLTDFGSDDFFVPSLKGVIASIHPEARVIDITHSVPSFDILAGGFVLYACYRYFPSQTVFVAVVDPGVGSSRKILLAESKKYRFIAPDNGILSPVLDEEKDFRLREINNDKYFLGSEGVTFEARDKMVPAAAWLSLGMSADELGPEIERFERMRIDKPRLSGHGIRGAILYVDKFGNLITNIPCSSLDPFNLGKRIERLRLEAGDVKIYWKQSYSQAKKGEIFFLCGSLGLIEIAVREGSAFEKLRASPGQSIELKFPPEKKD
jgi:S-adenosylmethionine hydrolase